MYLSRMTVNENGKESKEFRYVLSQAFRNEYTVHQSIWGLFSDSPQRQRDFLYRVDMRHSRPAVYAVSHLKPLDSSSLWTVESKHYEPKLAEGMRFSFLLRANAVVTKQLQRGEGNATKGHRHDVVMEARRKLKEQSVPREKWPTQAQIAQEKGVQWLISRAQSKGFDVKDKNIRVESYQRQTFPKGKGNGVVTIGTIDFTGELTVHNAAVFLDTLYRGIGPAKGLGCGMMLIRRA